VTACLYVCLLWSSSGCTNVFFHEAVVCVINTLYAEKKEKTYVDTFTGGNGQTEIAIMREPDGNGFQSCE